MNAGIKSFMRYSPSTMLRVEKAAYSNGRIALRLFDAETEEPVATATINVPEADLASDEVIVKNYSENEGVTRTLILGGVINPLPVSTLRTGHVLAEVYKLSEGWTK